MPTMQEEKGKMIVDIESTSTCHLISIEKKKYNNTKNQNGKHKLSWPNILMEK
jgi:hypothetical protein